MLHEAALEPPRDQMAPAVVVSGRPIIGGATNGYAANGHAPLEGEPAGDGLQRPRRQRNRNRGGGQRAGVPPSPQFEVPLPEAPLVHQAVEASVVEPEAEPVAIGRDPSKASCTMAQMRRFIKSRPYVPIHELRRRFEIEGFEDDVNPVPTDRGTIFVGLPPQEARFLSDLIRTGEVGCEMLLDPCSPGVIGVYAMRPVARQ